MRKILKWLENFWYHHKWKTIVIAFFAIVLGIGIFQMTTKESYDVNVLYTGPAVLSQDQKNELASAFADVVPEDLNEDGAKTVLINGITVLSNEQVAEKEEEAKAESDSLYYDYNAREDAISQVSTLIATGNTVICLMDDYMYQKYKAENAFRPLSEVLDVVPEEAIDEYSIYLADTPFGSYYGACKALPADTILCLRKSSVMNSGLSQKEAKAYYELCVETFKALFTFSVAE